MKYYLNNEEIEIEEYIKLFNSRKYDIQVQNDETHLVLNLNKRKQYLRQQRKKIFVGFDTYKANIDYGIESPETEEEHELILEWYQNLLELEESAFENIPERIKYYL